MKLPDIIGGTWWNNNDALICNPRSESDIVFTIYFL